MLDFLGVRQDFVDREFLRSLPDQQLLLGEIFRSEYFVGRRDSSRKLPPAILVLGAATVVAMF